MASWIRVYYNDDKLDSLSLTAGTVVSNPCSVAALSSFKITNIVTRESPGYFRNIFSFRDKCVLHLQLWSICVRWCQLSNRTISILLQHGIICRIDHHLFSCSNWASSNWQEHPNRHHPSHKTTVLLPQHLKHAVCTGKNNRLARGIRQKKP